MPNDVTEKLLPIAAGQLWAMPKEGPWPGHRPPVTILDVKDGWVRYDMGAPYRDERMTLDSFLRVYTVRVQ